MPPSLAEQLSGKRFGLVLSAGFFGFYGHAGFLQALEAANLSPYAYAGTSAGGLVAAYAAAGMPAGALERLLLEQRREGFWDPDWLGAALGAARGGTEATGLLRGERFRALLEKTLPVSQFEHCPKPLVVVATELSSTRPVTLGSGPLAPAIHATCAYPGLFRAVPLADGWCWDGGIVDKAPALALAQSPAGLGLEALLVHYLPSRDTPFSGGAFGYARGLNAGVSALRRDHFRLQLEVLEARQIPTYVMVSELPPVSPRALEQGPRALAAAKALTQAALEAPAVRFQPYPQAQRISR